MRGGYAKPALGHARHKLFRAGSLKFFKKHYIQFIDYYVVIFRF